MTFELFLIIASVTVAIYMLFFIGGIVAYDKNIKGRTLNKKDSSDWLLSEMQDTVFKVFYGKNDDETLAGIDRNLYERYCKVLHIESNYEKLVTKRLEGGLLLIICMALAYSFFKHNQIIVSLILAIIGMGAFYFLWIIPYGQVKNAAENRLYEIQNELPRYLSLLEKALDLPVDQAMLITAQNFPSPLSEDIITSITKVNLGADGWGTTLVDLARVYDIEVFSDFILEIVNSYEQGVNIRHLVERKISEVEQSRLFAVEAHDAKIKTLIFLPVIIFKVMPLMVLICMPLVSDFI